MCRFKSRVATFFIFLSVFAFAIPDFAVSALEASLKRTVFEVGEDMEIRITANRNAAVCVFNLKANDKAAARLPVFVQKANILAPGQTLTVPSAEAPASLRVYPLPGEKETSEAMLGGCPTIEESTAKAVVASQFAPNIDSAHPWASPFGRPFGTSSSAFLRNCRCIVPLCASNSKQIGPATPLSRDDSYYRTASSWSPLPRARAFQRQWGWPRPRIRSSGILSPSRQIPAGKRVY